MEAIESDLPGLAVKEAEQLRKQASVETQAGFFQELAELDTRFEALEPELEVVVRDPSMGLEGFVVVDSTLAAVGGPLGRVGKGGTRLRLGLTLEEVKRLAKIMTLKNAGVGLPFGGAKSGINADPTAPGFEEKYRCFARLVKPLLWVNGGLFGGLGYDVGAIDLCQVLNIVNHFLGFTKRGIVNDFGDLLPRLVCNLLSL